MVPSTMALAVVTRTRIGHPVGHVAQAMNPFSGWTSLSALSESPAAAVPAACVGAVRPLS